MYDFETLDFYELLGVSRSASSEEIKRAYRREIAKYHPDRHGNASAADLEYARRRSQMLTEAYATLSDFAARSAYNLDQRSRDRRRASVPRPAPPPPSSRDHQAELYDQARSHIDAGRLLQAAATLRQLQQINPFYRDVTELLASTEAQLRNRGASQPQKAWQSHSAGRLVLMVGTAVLVLAGGSIWWFGWSSAAPGVAEEERPIPVATASIPPATVPIVLVAPTLPATPVPAETPTVAPSTTPSPSVPPASEARMTPDPTPTISPVPAPTPAGSLLLQDDTFESGWATVRSAAWSVGPRDGRYRVIAAPQIGAIWSYRSVPSSDVHIAVDMEVIEGEGGLMLRFRNEQNYVLFTLVPQTGDFRLEQLRDGTQLLLVSGTRAELRTGDGRSRIEAFLRGSRVRVAVNGQVMAEVDVAGIPSTPRFGVAVVARETRAEALFDNLEIRALP